MSTKDKTLEALNLAKHHAETTDKPMKSSAQLCANDADNLFQKEDYRNCQRRSLDSLAYSVGIFHQDYCKVQILLNGFVEI